MAELSSLSAAAGFRDILFSPEADDIVRRALQAVRLHLGLQVAYVSEFVGDLSVFRAVDAPGLEHLIKPGDARSLDEVYCRHILAGRLPELIPDTAAEPLAMAMPITAAVPIGAHVSVPLRLPDGALYGMFCCLGPQADPSLNARDLGMMRAFAELAAFQIDRDRRAAQDRDTRASRVRDVLDGEAIDIVYQPIQSMRHGRTIGLEALSRFPGTPARTPDLWFAEAAAVGLGPELERMAIRRALAALPLIPQDVYVAVNASPATVLSGIEAAIEGHAPERIVLEITEHDCVDDFVALTDAVAPLRARGVRLAVDDAGAGHSGLQQILQLRPDLIKLDRFLIHGIQHDPGKRALAAALRLFAQETGSRLVAEGVETEGELAMLRALGVDAVQGYAVARPAPLADVLAALEGAGCTARREASPAA
ncbi:EAL domain-containing protein [Sphingosinithalassobacter sp. CS137]|uniref:sensor domain-containing phosphodiesterase n=1 Tax=Sphingosinithalassobacter sp. CS137 TaxID=2762748 RepID=UPI00165E0151|nr:EAL domain-containing protein [Sphingosinithalassobacter sp. CS137]